MVLVAPKVVMIDFSEKNLIILKVEETFIAECEYLSKKTGHFEYHPAPKSTQTINLWQKMFMDIPYYSFYRI